MSSIMTVSQLNRYMKFLVDGDKNLTNVMVSGEISNFKAHFASGHLYFSIKDATGTLSVVMFKDSASMLKFVPQDGMKVIIAGRISVYEQQGKYQLYAKSMQPDGLGALNLAYEQLKEKLENEGVFNNHRSLPEFPEKIAVITSETGAVFHDIRNISSRRWPLTEIVLIPSAVQGELAEAQLVSAVKKANSMEDIDLIIIGRGGGSMEDLWCFNSEELARTIFASRIPVISAVGHETDFTICDFAADLRAPTPSAAAELAVPDMFEVEALLDSLIFTIRKRVTDKIDVYKLELDRLANSRHLRNPELIYQNQRNSLDNLTKLLEINVRKKLAESKADLVESYAELTALNPLNVLNRGYAVASKDSKLVKSITDIESGDKLNIELSDGSFTAKVLDKKEKDNA
ncbi:MAG: exodeoxyribonuclease VII large subunit [Clostridia bacterium]|nr:exodeoxyribonuclease VII large subunit [Clostridia bacterium]